MGVILAAYYRRQADPTITVPAPVHGEPATTPWWYDHLASHAQEFAYSGITHVLLPPVTKSSALDYPAADGYGVYNDYDLGSDKAPTRYGTAERLQRLCAILRANGITPLVDWVPHQRSGGRGATYTYKSATGQPGRFPKHPGCFRELYPGEGLRSGRVRQDPVPAPADDFMFGDELCPVNCHDPQGYERQNGVSYVQAELNRAGDWLFRRLDLGGCRNDCTKGQAISAVRKWANYGAIKGKILIGEYAEGNKDTLAWYCSNFERDGAYYHMTYDFEVKYRCRDMCNAASHYDMRKLVSAGLASKGWPWSSLSVTFVENPDSDTNGFGAVVWNKLLAYAWVLTSEGFPSIYFRDYAKDQYCYGDGDLGNGKTLHDKINNLVWIHENLAGGTTVWRHAEYQYVIYERLGYAPDNKPGCLVGLNNDTWNPGWKQQWVKTNFGPRQRLHDYTGHAPDLYTNDDGWVELRIPPNENGKGYVCYAPDGYSQPMQQQSGRTTQEFEGANDLDIPPAYIGQTSECTRIWVAKGTPVNLQIINYTKLPDALLQPVASSPTGVVHRSVVAAGTLDFMAKEEGWYGLRVDGSASRAYPDGTPVPYILRAEYRAPKTLAGS